MTIRFPVAIELGTTETAFGVVVPDLPGCFSAGDTLDEAFAGAEEAAAGWIDAALDAGRTMPSPSSLDRVRDDPDFEGWSYGVVAVETALLDDRVERA